MTTEPAPCPVGGDLIKRHKLSTRLWHWLSTAIMAVMLMSGLMIFNTHPRLYWGSYGADPDPAWLEIGATEDDKGYLRIGQLSINTTGVLGVSNGMQGAPTARAFPKWTTLPRYSDLVAARHWHLSFAWFFAAGTLLFGIWSVLNGHVRRDLLPTRSELSVRHLCREVAQHAKFCMPCGEDAVCYNALQKLVYLGVSGILIPVMILSGLTMSPWFNSIAPWLLDLFGGRQSARSIHFITAFAIIGFVIFHLFMVIAAGPLNEIRSMITGWFRLPMERDK